MKRTETQKPSESAPPLVKHHSVSKQLELTCMWNDIWSAVLYHGCVPTSFNGNYWSRVNYKVGQRKVLEHNTRSRDEVVREIWPKIFRTWFKIENSDRVLIADEKDVFLPLHDLMHTHSHPNTYPHTHDCNNSQPQAVSFQSSPPANSVLIG